MHNTPILRAYLPYALFFAGLFVSFLFLTCSTFYLGTDGLILSICGFLVLLLVATWFAAFDVRHPLVWFTTSFTLYSLSAPLLHLLGLYKPSWSFNQAVTLQYFAMLAFTLAALCPIRSYSTISFKGFAQLANGRTPFLALSLIASFAYLYGYMTIEDEIRYGVPPSASVFLRLDIAYTFLLMGIAVSLIGSMVLERKRCVFFTAAFGIYFLVSLLIGGERDILVRLVLTYVYVYITFYRAISTTQLIIGGVVLVALSTLAGMFKNILLTKELVIEVGGMTKHDSFMSFGSMARILLGSEFRTAGSNLTELMDAVPSRIPFWNGQATLTEVLSAFHLGLLSDRDSTSSVASWFTETFYGFVYERGGGMGFTLVGQGYLDFGLTGVLVLFFSIGLLTRALYNWSAHTVIGYIVYIISIPVFMFSIRQTISPIVSQILKHILLSVLLMYLIGTISKQFHLRLSCTQPSSQAQRA